MPKYPKYPHYIFGERLVNILRGIGVVTGKVVKYLLLAREVRVKHSSYRKPTDLPQMCYSGRLICSMLALIPQSGDFSGAALGVRSVALLQVA